jgi:hypothetical protein
MTLHPKTEPETRAVGNQPRDRGGPDRRPRGADPAGVAVPRAIVLLLALGLAGCGRLDLPGVAYPGSGSDGARRLVEDRVWLDTGADAASGTLRAFLSDGTLVMTSCVEVYRLAPWRWIEGQTLVWEEDGRSIRGEVVLAGRDELILAIELDGEATTRRFSAALAPVVCPDLR